MANHFSLKDADVKMQRNSEMKEDISAKEWHAKTAIMIDRDTVT